VLLLLLLLPLLRFSEKSGLTPIQQKTNNKQQTTNNNNKVSCQGERFQGTVGVLRTPRKSGRYAGHLTLSPGDPIPGSLCCVSAHRRRPAHPVKGNRPAPALVIHARRLFDGRHAFLMDAAKQLHTPHARRGRCLTTGPRSCAGGLL